MIEVKPTFEQLVHENAGWLLNFIKRRLGSDRFAEDIAQEVWIRAFRAYEGYVAVGKERAWLARIAKNHIASRFAGRFSGVFDEVDMISLDDGIGDILASDESPEEELLERELARSVMRVLDTLPGPQREVLDCRYLRELSVDDTARTLGIPSGSVKSRTHYAIAAMRRAMGVTFTAEKGENIMTCREAYKYLFVYAGNLLAGDKKCELEAHLSKCEHCRGIAEALKGLIPTMTFARDDERSHFSITFPEIGLSYIGSSAFYRDFERINAILRENNGEVPEGMWINNSGFNGSADNLLAEFDGKGRELGFECHASSGNVRVRHTHIERIERCQWFWSVLLFDTGSPVDSIEQSREAPNLWYGKKHNYFGCDVKSALYHAVASDATNIRIKRGNGVIDCGAYSFPYVDRYVAADEGIMLEYSFNSNALYDRLEAKLS